MHEVHEGRQGHTRLVAIASEDFFDGRLRAVVVFSGDGLRRHGARVTVEDLLGEDAHHTRVELRPRVSRELGKRLTR